MKIRLYIILNINYLIKVILLERFAVTASSGYFSTEKNKSKKTKMHFNLEYSARKATRHSDTSLRQVTRTFSRTLF